MTRLFQYQSVLRVVHPHRIPFTYQTVHLHSFMSRSQSVRCALNYVL
jgi:hypothetical protein